MIKQNIFVIILFFLFGSSNATDLAIGINTFPLLELAPNATIEINVFKEWGIGISFISNKYTKNWTEFGFYEKYTYRLSLEIRKYKGLFSFIDKYAFKMGGFLGCGYMLSQENEVKSSFLTSIGFRGSFIEKDMQKIFPYFECGFRTYIGNTDKIFLFNFNFSGGIIIDFTPEMIPKFGKKTVI